MKNKHEILLGLTTTPNSNWMGKVEEMKKFGIKKIALFPTFLPIEKRRQLYDALSEIDGLEIPHVHLRSQDMEAWEMELFEKKYKTIVYNIHIGSANDECLEKYQNKIFVENHFRPFDEKYLAKFAGICFDVQHHKRSKIQAPKAFQQLELLLEKYSVGCCHISAYPQFRYIIKRLWKRLGGHYMLGVSELEYILPYKKYLPYYISLELENSFQEQLNAKSYLENKLAM
ncbi:MAG: hypothetical protein WCI36_04005 [bacterium]